MAKDTKKALIIYILFLFILTFCFGCSLDEDNIENKKAVSNDNKKEITETIIKDELTSSTTKFVENKTTKTTLPTTGNKTSSEHVTDFKIRIVDKNNKSVSNLKVDIINITGSKYNYIPDLAYTNNEGVTSGQGDYKKYNVIVRDMSDGTIYNTFSSSFEIKKDNQTYTFVWPYITPEQRKKRHNNCIYFEFKNGDKILKNLHIELYVGHYETNERWNSSYPEKIDLGYTDENGKLVWDSPKPGKYTIFAYIMKGDVEKKVSKKITVDNIPYTYSVSFS